MSAQDQTPVSPCTARCGSSRPSAHPRTADDFPDRDKLRYTCLFVHELLPEVLPETTTEMTGALPNLVQPGNNYNLVFAEEFNESEPRKRLPCESASPRSTAPYGTS